MNDRSDVPQGASDDDGAAPAGFRIAAGEPDEIDLELLSLGAVEDPEAARRIAAAAEGPLRAARAEIAAARDHFAATARPLPVRRSSLRRVAGGLAVAAGLAAVALLLGRSGPEAGTRAMGALPVELAVRHAGGVAQAPDGVYREGDELFLRLVAPEDGRVSVATLEADGDVSVLDPGSPVDGGGTWRLGGAARLDGHPGREWLVVELGAEPRSPEALEDDLRALLPDPAAHAGPHRFVTELTRTGPPGAE